MSLEVFLDFVVFRLSIKPRFSERSRWKRVSVRSPPPNGADFGALVSTIDGGHLEALYERETEETILVG